MKPGVAGQGRYPLVDPRVVLHRAGAERVRAGVEVEVAARDAVVVADDLRLGDLGEVGGGGTQEVFRDEVVERRVGEFPGVGGGRTAARRPATDLS